MKIVGLLLAGGQSRRMGGGDKALRVIGGVPLLERVIERMRPQVETLVLNANGDPARFAAFGLPVIADGTLVGIISIGDVVKTRVDELETEKEQLVDYIRGR